MDYLVHIAKHPIHANVTIPGSKSITNRALLLAAMADGVSELNNILLSDDTRVFMDALQNLGLAVMLDVNARSCIVGGASGTFPKKKSHVWCGDAGTAARFLLAACASTAGIYQFDGSTQLKNRPIELLLQILCAQGAKILPEDAEKMPFAVLGTDGLQGGEYEIESSQTGQFVSALLMVAPFAKSPVLLKTQNLVSEPYVDMTCAMMAEFGVQVKRMHHARFYVPVPQRYWAQEYVIEPDLSTASYFFAAAAVTNGEITIQKIDREQSKQGDIKFLNVLEKMGCRVKETAKGLTVIGTPELRGINVDMRDFSDTFMTLAAIAPFANSPTTITNIAHTRFKESNRIAAMRAGLEKLQVQVESGDDWIKIHPGTPRSGKINSFQDHRIAMAFSVLGLRVSGVKIINAECVSKTCPEFFTLWEQLIS
jgi:3-phosphoshikimate 1-carboxyvinyltransferase